METLNYANIGLILLMAFMVYFVMFRPERMRKKEEEKMRKSLKVGDEVTTISGVVGTVCAVKESTIVIETGADRVRLEMVKWGISSRNEKEED